MHIEQLLTLILEEQKKANETLLALTDFIKGEDLKAEIAQLEQTQAEQVEDVKPVEPTEPTEPAPTITAEDIKKRCLHISRTIKGGKAQAQAVLAKHGAVKANQVPESAMAEVYAELGEIK